ncbi:MAG: universal stress protein [Desulfobacterales bacterium]|nr:universal stress protein [Desulfobacterales bacterium]
MFEKILYPLKEILKVEADEQVSLVILGSHGRTNLEEVFLGSVSEKVVRRCKSPILVIKR